MKKFYFSAFVVTIFLVALLLPNAVTAQNCSLSATYATYESRCTSTGSIEISVTGGSGTYQYKATGSTATNYTSSNVITGLLPGRYLITIKDVVSNCVYSQDSVTIGGNYTTPNFTMTATRVTCKDGNDGKISVSGVTFGLGPFSYKIIAPSVSAVGTVSANGNFTGLLAGNYFVQLSDSCGAIQTRSIEVNNFDWFISASTITKFGCDSVSVNLILRDNFNNVTPHVNFTGYMYGASHTAGDTTWYTTPTFKNYKGNKRRVTVFVKDVCGNIKSVVWNETAIPSVNAAVTISNKACSTFTASLSSPVNLTAPTYCIYNSSNVLVACNSSAVFNNLLYGNYCIRVTDVCYDTVIVRCIAVTGLVPSLGSSVTTTPNGCLTFTASVITPINLTNPNYCLFDASNTLIGCNSTGTFTGIAYGSYSIQMTNNAACYDTVITRYFSRAATAPSLGAIVANSNMACSTFTANVTAIANWNSAQFCLYDSSNVLISCNTTGIFTNLTYGSYCIKATNNPACYDTTITRCFNVYKPVPTLASTVSTSNFACSTFTATATGAVNWTNIQFCLYNALNVVVACNTTGVFNNLPYGAYCLSATNDAACYDTTITRCFSVEAPRPTLEATVTLSSYACATFTATSPKATNWNNINYCLYNSANVQVACNTTGVFTNIPYGSYSITASNNASCYDTTIIRYFAAAPLKPSLGATINITNRNCSTFTASTAWPANVFNPQYGLYNSMDVLVTTNSTGVFNNVAYGSYCIKLQNDPTCYDTLITRCFTTLPLIPTVDLTASKSCQLIGATDLRVTAGSGTTPYTIRLYSPSNVLLQTAVTSASTYWFYNQNNLAAGLNYKVILTDACGYKDTAVAAPIISVANRNISMVAQCPSSASPSGYSDVMINIIINNIGGTITTKVIKKDGVLLTINPTLSIGYVYLFSNLEPATYIFDTDLVSCGKHVYDTVIVKPYYFPNMVGTKAYQCEDGAFTISASTIFGVAPYKYEIFGSSPATPSIQTAPQAVSLFNINNGNSYSLIRLRVVDGCGNASLTDASVLPLSNLIVRPDRRECFNDGLTLRVDSINDAVFKWYKRIEPNDSILVGTGASLFIPSLQLADTGRYFCKAVINNGCLVMISNYTITGFCNLVLPVEISLNGVKQEQGNKLTWKSAGISVKSYELERSNISNRDFVTVKSVGATAANNYDFLDTRPPGGNNFYRLKLLDASNGVKYSNVILLKNSALDVSFYPNPVNNMLYISISDKLMKDYHIEMYTSTGQMLSSKTFKNIQNAVINYPREASMVPGIYLITVTDLSNKEKETFKVIYR